MLSTDDGAETYFLNFSKAMFTNFLDQSQEVWPLLERFWNPFQKPKHYKPDFREEIDRHVIDITYGERKEPIEPSPQQLEKYKQEDMNRVEALRKELQLLAQQEIDSDPNYPAALRRVLFKMSHIRTIRIDRYIKKFSATQNLSKKKSDLNPYIRLLQKINMIGSALQGIPDTQLKLVHQTYHYWHAVLYNALITYYFNCFKKTYLS